MKKLFLLLTAVLLSAGMAVQAQLLDAVHDSPEGGYVFDENGQISGRHNAPMATYEQSFTWDEFTTIGNPNGGGNWTECDMQFYRNGNTSSRPHLRLCFLVKDAGSRTYISSSGREYVFPQNGTYTIQTGKYLWSIGAYNNTWSYNWDSQFWPDNVYTYWLKSGTVEVADGHRRNDQEPYMVVNSTANINESGSTVTSGTYVSAKFTIGEPLYTYNIVAATTNSSYGTAGASTSSVEEGGSVTLTATPTNGIFQGWSLDGGNTIISGTNNQISYTVTLDADAGYNGQTFTYTAVFIPDNLPTHTITVQAENNDHCTVEGGDTYYEGNTATLSATSKNDHLYFFQKWQKLNGSTYEDFVGNDVNPLSVTITADATYRAVYRVASNGTISAYASPSAAGTATVSPSGSLTGGTAVTLTATANDGYSFSQWSDGNKSNPRVVYVDNDASYTAQFVEGIEINVQSFLFRDCTSGGWFNFQGITTGYQFVFFVNNSSVVGNYTQAHLDSDNKIYDHGTELSITTASFSVTADATNYYLDGEFVCSNGKRYIVHTWHEKRYGPFSNDEASSGDYDGTSFPTITSNDLQGDGSYLVKANAGNPSGMSYAYQTEIDFIIDSEKQHGSEKIPGGFYFVNHSGAAGTVKATNAIGYLDLNTYNDYDDIGGSYVRETYHQSGGNIGSLWIWTLNDGYVRVTNVNEQYYMVVRARNSFYYTAYYTVGATAPFDVDITSDANGSVDIAFYASNWGTTVHYEEGTNEFFSGNVLNLTATPNSGYEFWRWSDESSSVENSAYGATRNVTVSGELTLQAIFREAVTTHNVSITTPTNGTITVSYNDGSDQSFTSGNRDIADGTTLTISAEGGSGYILGTLTVNGVAFTSGSTFDLTDGITIAATFISKNVTLLDNENNTHYNTFKTTYNNKTVNATYARTFGQGRWSTLCLPFNVTSGQMTALKMKGRVYVFDHATGDATINDEVILYFAAAKSLEAGKCYIVNANNALAGMSSFSFSSVTINLAADSVPDLTIAGAYDNLGGYKQSGNIELIGTLRKGTLKGTGEHETYMGLKDNMIYYPNTSTGSTVLAYRGVFRSTTALNAQRVRIVAEGDEGEEVTELEVVNGELQAVPETRKFIRDGVLYIEREGVIYDAAGQRVN